MEKKRPSILQANNLYLVVALLFITLGWFAQVKDIYKGVFIIQYMIILLPSVILALVKKYDFKQVFRLNKITIKQVLTTLLIVILAYPIAMFFNYIMLVIISMFGEIQPPPIPVPENTSQALLGFFLFAITPGICEEMMFRGVMMSAYEKKGHMKAIVLTGLLFGIFHFNLQNLLGPAFLGILFGYIVYKTNSIYNGMIAHTFNNTIALILTMAVQSSGIENTPSVDIETQHLLIGLVALGVIAIILSVIVYFLLKSLSPAKGIQESSYQDTNEEYEKITIKHILPIMVTIIMFIYVGYAYLQYIKI